MRQHKFRVWDGEKMLKPLYLKDIVKDHPEYILRTSGELMEFTGSKDRNGAEIYEGDVITDGTLMVAIFWSQHNVGFWTATGTNLAWTDCIVMGNIYENPDLIANSEIVLAKLREPKYILTAIRPKRLKG